MGLMDRCEKNKVCVDWYGKETRKGSFDVLKRNKYARYMGEIQDKSEGLFGYKFHIAIENCCENGYFTEKITDSIMSECLTFYIGCPDLCRFVCGESYITLDIFNVDKSFETLRYMANDKVYTERLNYILEAKNAVMTELNPWIAIDNKVRKSDF